MKMIAILILVVGLTTSYAETDAQTAKVNLKFNTGTVKDVIEEIEHQTNLSFMYDNDVFKVDRQISIEAENETLKSVVEKLILGENLKYEMINRYIIITSAKEPPAEQQGKKVTGKLTDQTRASLPGVSVVVKGTSTGVVTDNSGIYSLSNIPENATLQFSFVGMKTQEVSVGNKTTINLVMVEEAIGLDEVVAVGYGTQRKKDLTGAVASLNMTEKDELPNTNVIQGLRGAVSGVNVNYNGHPGSGGSITIRGLTSLSAGTSPLIIVDGIPLSGSLSDINPTDVQSIDVLKDGSASAVYGAKSANGVILITTKKGTSSKPIVQYSMSYGKQEYSHRIKVLDGPGYVQKIIDYQKSNGVQNPDLKLYMQNLEYQNYLDKKTIDPIAYTLQDAPTQTYDLSVSGKNERTTYYMSGSYTNEKGIVFNDNFKRISFRINIENKITDWLTIGLNTTFSNRDDSGVKGDLTNAVMLSPYSQMTDSQGNQLVFVHGGGEAMAQNPIFSATRARDVSKNQNLTGNLFSEIQIPFIKGLSYRLNYSNTFNWYKNFRFSDPYYLENQKNTGGGYKTHSENYNWLVENIVKYKKHFAKIHDIEATLLYSRDHSENSYSNLSSSNFFTGVLGYNQLQIGTTPIISTNAQESNGISMMSRINYRFNDRYLLTLLARRDGYSAFGKGNKFGIFPSMALGWVVKEENFLKNVKFIDNLKLRYSYGATGNQAISPYNSLAQMAQTTYVFGNGSPTYIGLYNRSMANEDLSWETTLASNAGLDFEILNKRLSGSVEYYFTKTKDLLMVRSIPVMTGYTAVLTNLGGVQNKGLEVTLNSTNLRTNGFEWNTTVTFSTNKNKITSLYGLDLNKDGIEDNDLGNNWFIGESIGAIFDYTLDGIYQTGETIPTGFKPGYFRIVDKNASGAADPGDRSIIGKTNPDFRLGLGNTWSYKNLSLYVFVNSSFGGMKSNPMLNPAGWFPEKLNIMDAGAYWTPENPSNTRPTIGYAMPFGHGFYESLTYVRIQDVSLSYDLPKTLISKARINSLKVYISAKNLATFTKWSGWDPEIDGIGTGSAIGRGGYPMIKTFAAGLNFSF